MTAPQLLDYLKDTLLPSQKVLKIPLYLILISVLSIASIILGECYLGYCVFAYFSSIYTYSPPLAAFLTACFFLLQALLLLAYARRLLRGFTLSNLVEEQGTVRKLISAFVEGLQGKAR
jgi:hypothetical protein